MLGVTESIRSVVIEHLPRQLLFKLLEFVPVSVRELRYLSVVLDVAHPQSERGGASLGPVGRVERGVGARVSQVNLEDSHSHWYMVREKEPSPAGQAAKNYPSLVFTAAIK